jgi:hypothetical protein
MAWVKSHQEIRQHPKTRKLARALGISVPQVVGHLHLIWWWAADYAGDGDLSGFDAMDLADAAMWEGDEETLLQALCNVGYIDTAEDGTHALHDWQVYQGNYIEKKRDVAERKRKSRESHKHVTRDIVVTEESVTPLDIDKKREEEKVQVLTRAHTPEKELPKTEPTDPLEGFDDIPAPQGDTGLGDFSWLDDETFARIGRPSSPSELAMVRKMAADGVPVPLVRQCIADVFAKFQPKHPRDKIKTLTYCESHIWDMHYAHQNHDIRGPGVVSSTPKFFRADVDLDPEFRDLYLPKPDLDPAKGADAVVKRTIPEQARSALARRRDGPVGRDVGG